MLPESLRLATTHEGEFRDGELHDGVEDGPQEPYSLERTYFCERHLLVVSKLQGKIFNRFLFHQQQITSDPLFK